MAGKIQARAYGRHLGGRGSTPLGPRRDTDGPSAALCDQYSSFSGSDDPSYPVRMHFAGPLPRYSRLKTFFRAILSTPIWILRYVVNLLFELGAIAAWFVIVILGRLPRGLFDVMVLANSYTARSDAYLFLLTETYPPFPGRAHALGRRGQPPGAGRRLLDDTCWIRPGPPISRGLIRRPPRYATRWRNCISPAKNALCGYAPAGSLWA